MTRLGLRCIMQRQSFIICFQNLAKRLHEWMKPTIVWIIREDRILLKERVKHQQGIVHIEWMKEKGIIYICSYIPEYWYLIWCQYMAGYHLGYPQDSICSEYPQMCMWFLLCQIIILSLLLFPISHHAHSWLHSRGRYWILPGKIIYVAGLIILEHSLIPKRGKIHWISCCLNTIHSRMNQIHVEKSHEIKLAHRLLSIRSL